jgi:hypothetical protein
MRHFGKEYMDVRRRADGGIVKEASAVERGLQTAIDWLRADNACDGPLVVSMGDAAAGLQADS